MAQFAFEEDSTEPEDLGLDDVEAPVRAQRQQPQTIVDELFAPEPAVPTPDDSEFDAQMSAVEKRLAVAQFYRMILDRSLFEDQSPESQQVDKEVQGFVRGRMKVLMGVSPDPVAKPVPEIFNPTEVMILKQIAALAAKRNPQPAAPVAAEPETKPVPALKPVAAPAAKPLPQMKPVQAKPVAAPQKPVAQQQAKPLAKSGVMDPAVDPRLPSQYRKDPTLVQKNGKWWVQCKNPDEELLWTWEPTTKQRSPLLKDVTLPARPAGVQIMQQPRIEAGANGIATSPQYDMLMERQGDAMLNHKEKMLSGQNASGIFGAHLLSSISGDSGGGE